MQEITVSHVYLDDLESGLQAAACGRLIPGYQIF